MGASGLTTSSPETEGLIALVRSGAGVGVAVTRDAAPLPGKTVPAHLVLEIRGAAGDEHQPPLPVWIRCPTASPNTPYRCDDVARRSTIPNANICTGWLLESIGFLTCEICGEATPLVRRRDRERLRFSPVAPRRVIRGATVACRSTDEPARCRPCRPYSSRGRMRGGRAWQL